MEQPASPTRELTVEEAISLAIALQKDGQLAGAQELYCRVLAVAPDRSDALPYSGVLGALRPGG